MAITGDASLDARRESAITRTRSAVVFSLTDVLGRAIASDARNGNGPVTLNDSRMTPGLNYPLNWPPARCQRLPPGSCP